MIVTRCPQCRHDFSPRAWDHHRRVGCEQTVRGCDLHGPRCPLDDLAGVEDRWTRGRVCRPLYMVDVGPISHRADDRLSNGIYLDLHREDRVAKKGPKTSQLLHAHCPNCKADVLVDRNSRIAVDPRLMLPRAAAERLLAGLPVARRGWDHAGNAWAAPTTPAAVARAIRQPASDLFAPIHVCQEDR